MKKVNLLLLLLIINLSLHAQWNNIKNGALWKDTNGNPVQAHGAGFLQVGTKWYMVGEDRTYWNAGVNLYSTSDFVNWKFEKKIIPTTAYRSDRFIERPKLMRCPSTGKFVVWCHYEQGNYGASEAASFVCDSVNGLYTLSFSGRPLNIKSRDCNVFVDNDGKGYFVSTTDENQHLTLFELSTDYLTPVKSTRLSRFDWQQREAPAIVRVGNTYFLISSKCTGWDPNQGTISYSTSLTSGWSAMTNVGNSTTFDTQAASILTVKGTSGTTYLYVGDRWQDPGLFESKTIIFPISFSGTSCTFKYKQQFDIDFTTGLTRETPITYRVPRTGWKIRAFSTQETSSENGAATNILDDNLLTNWHTQYSGTAAVAPHFIEVDMGANYTVSGIHCVPRLDSYNDGIIRQAILTVSTDGTHWTTVAGGTWMPYNSEVYFQPIQARYFRLTSFLGISAVVSEIYMLQNTPAYTPFTLTPTYQIGTGSWLQSENITVNQASILNLAPPATGVGSTWAWSLPNSRFNNARTYSIPNVSFADSGSYTACLVDAYNKISKVDYQVKVNMDILVYRRKLAYTIKQAQAVYSVDLIGAVDLNTKIVESQNISYASYGATKEQLEAQVVILENQIKKYIQDNISAGVDKTDLITNSGNFSVTNPSGWSDVFTAVGNGCGEFYNDSSFVFSQTVNNLPNGKYLVGVKAFYRGGSNDAGVAYNNANEKQVALFYASYKSIFVSSMYSVPFTGAGSQNGFINNLATASSLFSNSSGYFDNWLFVTVTDNKLTIKFSKTTYIADDWCAVGNFRLYNVALNTAVNDIKSDQNNKNSGIYGIDGRYYGTGSVDNMHLEPGLYIINGRKCAIVK